MAEDFTIQVGQIGLYDSLLKDAKRAEATIARTLGRVRIEALEKPLGNIRRAANEFDRSMNAANARVLAFGASVGILYSVQRGFQELIKSTVQVERSLADINLALNASEAQLEGFSRRLFAIAKDTGQSFKVVADAALEFSRQGLGLEETSTRVRDALILVRRSGVDVGTAIGGITAVINGFSNQIINSTELVNKLVAADIRFAVSAGDLITAFTRVGSSAQDAGLDIDELIGLITSLRQTTGREAPVIGNSLKTIFTRIVRPDTLKTLEQIGIETGYSTGQFKDALSIITQLAQRYRTLDDAGKSYISQLVGGVYQINQLKAALDDLGRGGLSIQARATEAAREATDEAIRGVEILNKTLGDRINRLQQSVSEIFADFGGQGLAKPVSRLVNIGQTVLDSINPQDGERVGREFGESIARGLGEFLAGPGLLVGATVLAKLFATTTKFATDAARSFLGLGSSTTKIRDLQLQINNALTSQGTSYNQIIAKTATRAEAEAEILRIIQQQIVAQRDLAGGVAASLYSKGLRFQNDNFTRAVLFSAANFRPGSAAIRRAVSGAEGILPAVFDEAKAIEKGIGGASASARPVVIPNFSFGGGKRGPIVANTDEHIVRNFAGGGDAIFNREMADKFGLPLGAKRIGRVPNFPSGYVPPNQLQKREIANRNFFPNGFLPRQLANAFKIDAVIGSLAKQEFLLKYRSASGSIVKNNVKLIEALPDKLRVINLKMRQEMESLGLSRVEAEKRAIIEIPRANVLQLDRNQVSYFARGHIPSFQRGFLPGNPYRFRRRTPQEVLEELGYSEADFPPDLIRRIQRQYRLDPRLDFASFLEGLLGRRGNPRSGPASIRSTIRFLENEINNYYLENELKKIPKNLQGFLEQEIEAQRRRQTLFAGRFGRPARTFGPEELSAFRALDEAELQRQASNLRSRGRLELDFRGFLEREGLRRPQFLLGNVPLLGPGGSYPIVPSQRVAGSGPSAQDVFGRTSFGGTIFVPPGGFGTVPPPPPSDLPKPAPSVPLPQPVGPLGFIDPYQNIERLKGRGNFRQVPPVPPINLPPSTLNELPDDDRPKPAPFVPILTSRGGVRNLPGVPLPTPTARGPITPVLTQRPRTLEERRRNLEDLSDESLGRFSQGHNAFLESRPTFSRFNTINTVRSILSGGPTQENLRRYAVNLARLNSGESQTFSDIFGKQFRQTIERVGPSTVGFSKAIIEATEKVKKAGASTEQVSKVINTLNPQLVRYSETVKRQNLAARNFFIQTRAVERLQNINEKLASGAVLDRREQRFFEESIKQQTLQRQIQAFEEQTGERFSELNAPLRRRLRERFARDATPTRNQILFEQNLANRQTRLSTQPFGFRDIGGFFSGSRELNREIRALQEELSASTGQRLTPQQRRVFEDRLQGLRAQRRANIGSRLQNAGIGISLGASVASGFFNDDSIIGAGLRGAGVGSLGFITGNPYVGVATTIGGAITSALDQYSKNQKPSLDRLTESLNRNSAAFAQASDAFDQYVQITQQLEDGIRSGDLRPFDVLQLRRRRSEAFDRIDNDQLRDILNTPGITLQQILERQQTINQQQSSNIQLGTAGASIINAFNNVKFTRTLATGIPGLPNVGALPYSTRPLFERGTPIFDRDTLRGLDAAAKQLANEFVNTKDGLSRIEEASRAISEEGIKEFQRRSFGGGASRSDAILDVFDRFFGDNVDEEEYLKFVNQAKQDSERALAILEELIKRTQEQGKRRLEDLEAQEQTIKRQIQLFRTVKDLTNEISRVSFNNFFGVTRTLNDQTIALAKIRGTASLFENSLSSQDTARVAGALDSRELAIRRNTEFNRLQEEGVNRIIRFLEDIKADQGKDALEVVNRLIGQGITDPFKIIEELRQGGGSGIAQNDEGFREVVQALERQRTEFLEAYRVQEALLRENNRIQELAARRNALRGFVGGQSPLDIFRQSRDQPEFLNELFGKARELPSLSIRNERNSRRRRFNLNSVAEEAIALQDQQRLFRELGIQPSAQQRFRFGQANQELGVQMLSQLFLPQLRNAGASRDIERLAGTGDVRNIDRAIERVRGRAEVAPLNPEFRNQLSILQNFRDLIPRAGEAGRVLGQDLGTRLVDGITGGATQADIVRAIQGSLKPEEFEKRFASEASAFSGIKELTNNVGKSIEASVQYVDPNAGLIGFIRNFDQKFFEIPIDNLSNDLRTTLLDIISGRAAERKTEEEKRNIELDIQLKKEQIDKLQEAFFSGFNEKVQEVAKITMEKSIAVAIENLSPEGRTITAEEYTAIINELQTLRDRLLAVERTNENKLPKPPGRGQIRVLNQT